MTCSNLFGIQTRANMQANTFILPFLCCFFGFYAMGFILHGHCEGNWINLCNLFYNCLPTE